MPCRLLILLSLLFAPGLHAQTAAAEQNAYPLLSLLYPGVIRDVPAMFHFIRAELPAVLVRDSSIAGATAMERDLRACDLVYLKALALRHGDTRSALLLAMLACLTHRAIPFSFGLHLPLTLESDSAHARRFVHLPAVLFSDTGPDGDRDKLQHFFGSAWLSFQLDNTAVVHSIGAALELGEETLIDVRENDVRDMRANRLGQAYALALEKEALLLPSALFRFWNATGRIPVP